MKSIQFKSKSSEKLTQAKNRRSTKAEKKVTQNANSPPNEDFLRPGSCPTNNYSWVPSRNWHKYLSGEQPINPPSFKSKFNPEHISNNTDEPLTKPGDELITLKLPTVNFCSPEKEIAITHRGLTINDLCDEDKRKIAQLVEELARCKQEMQETAETVFTLKNKVTELKTSLKSMMAEKSSENKSISMIKSQHLNEQNALKKQLSELNQLLYQMQVQKSTSDVQMKTITVQAEKMTRAIHAMHRENTELQIELQVTKERLNVAQLAVSRMTNDLKEVQEQIRPVTEDKACQSSDDILTERVHVKKIDQSESAFEDQQILSELFFNKSLQREFSPKETIIFLPADSKTPLLNCNDS